MSDGDEGFGFHYSSGSKTTTFRRHPTLRDFEWWEILISILFWGGVMIGCFGCGYICSTYRHNRRELHRRRVENGVSLQGVTSAAPVPIMGNSFNRNGAPTLPQNCRYAEQYPTKHEQDLPPYTAVVPKGTT